MINERVFLKAYAYIRVSSQQQTAEGKHGLARQRQTIKMFLDECNNNDIQQRFPGIDVGDIEVMEDPGLSAFHAKNWGENGQLGKFYTRVMAGEISNVWLLIENIDRISRGMPVQAINKISNMLERNIYIFEIETKTVFSRFSTSEISALGMSLNRSHAESKRKSIMAAKTHRQKIEEYLKTGKLWTTSKKKLPRWIDIVDSKYVVNVEQQQIIKYVFTMYLDGHGNAPLVRRLNESGMLDNGVPWTTVSLNRLLRDERLIGVRVIGSQCSDKSEQSRYENAYPICIDKNLFYNVQRKINQHNGSRQDRTTKRQRNLFNGVSRCFFCGTGMVVDVNDHGGVFMNCVSRRHRDFERCPNGRAINYKRIEKCMVEFIQNINWGEIYSPGKNDKSDAEKIRIEMADLKIEIERLSDQIDKCPARSLSRLIDAQIELTNQFDNLQTKLNALESRVLKKLDIKPDDQIFNQDNIELRQNFNVQVKKVVQTLSLGKLNDELVIGELKYFSERISHIVLIEPQIGKLVSWGVYRVHDDGTIWFESNFCTFDVNDPDNTGYPTEDEISKFSNTDRFLLSIVNDTLRRAHQLSTQQ
ncbi:recombinase family protein [Edwardsiella tarda]|uniref:recombinase family protein n=1 Tax=Edwardsiella tarda TaxID=636 RepID=UPI00351BF255